MRIVKVLLKYESVIKVLIPVVTLWGTYKLMRHKQNT